VLARIDDDGIPSESRKALETQALDLSPFEVVEVPYKAGQLRFHTPKVFSPRLDESQKLLIIEDDHLNLHVYGSTREQLLDELWLQLIVLWEEYACERDEVLTDEALQLKARLLRVLEKR
jgi:hypothetical protein